MMLQVFDALVALTARVPVAGVVVIVLLGLATDVLEALTHRPLRLRRRTRDVLLS
jgi:hypothetical protein